LSNLTITKADGSSYTDNLLKGNNIAFSDSQGNVIKTQKLTNNDTAISLDKYQDVSLRVQLPIGFETGDKITASLTLKVYKQLNSTEDYVSSTKTLTFSIINEAATAVDIICEQENLALNAGYDVTNVSLEADPDVANDNEFEGVYS